MALGKGRLVREFKVIHSFPVETTIGKNFCQGLPNALLSKKAQFPFNT